LLATVAGCSNGSEASSGGVSDGLKALASGPGTLIADPDPTRASIALSKVVHDRAGTVLLAPAGDQQAQAQAASIAVHLSVPLLLTPAGNTTAAGEDPWAALAAELKRLGTSRAVHIGPAPPDTEARLGGPKLTQVPADPAAVGALAGDGSPTVEALPIDKVRERLATLDSGGGVTVVAVAPPPSGAAGELPKALKKAKAASAPAGTFGLVDRDHPASIALIAALRSAGLPVIVAPHGDPRGVAGARELLTAAAPTHVVAISAGASVHTPEIALGLARTIVTGAELPGGGQLLFPDRRIVVLYGHPGAKTLGALGEQDAAAAVDRAKTLAAGFDGSSQVPVVPGFEIITTLASSEAGDDGDYSSEMSIDDLRPWVDAATKAGMYVVLDLQPGYTDFLTQAKRYEELLKLSNVGLALDPEWRLAPGQMHITHIGSVTADEVNATADWLAGIVRDNALPQKLFMVHQFRTGMVKERERVDVPPELALLIQMDGNGTQDEKLVTWKKILADPPVNAWFGWKNFYKEDRPLRAPAATVALEPSPMFISYQ